MARTEVRGALLDTIRKEIMGPYALDEKIGGILPTTKYITGIIYPEVKRTSTSPQRLVAEGEEIHDEDEETHTEAHMPLSMGLSAIIALDRLSKPGVTLKISGAIYKEEDGGWRRCPISKGRNCLELPSSVTKIVFGDKKLRSELPLKGLPGSSGDELDGLYLICETSPVMDREGKTLPNRGYLSTFLVNKRSSIPSTMAGNALYQTYICISTNDVPAISTREHHDSYKDDDLQSLSLMYHDRHEFGVGHGTSVNWDPLNPSDLLISDLSSNGQRPLNNSLLPPNNIEKRTPYCYAIETTFFPEYHARWPEFDILGRDGKKVAMNMFMLSDEGFLSGEGDKRAENISALRSFTSLYEDWIAQTFSTIKEQEHALHKDAFQKNRKHCYDCLSRIREGIDLLEKEDDAYAAFCLMNRAMWLQYINKKKAQKAKGPYVIDLNDYSGEWRPFQLGFILQTLPSLYDTKHPDRDVLDLLWVSTGAGKTEAYLGLVAFQTFLSRVQHRAGDTDGVEVMMRYTLRLLTLQQFQRAARLILACEHIRLTDRFAVLDGCKPFSVGLFVGQTTTPNITKSGQKWKGITNDYELFKLFEKNKENKDRAKEFSKFEQCGSTAEYAIGYWSDKKELPEDHSPVQFITCPWCGTELRPKDFEIDGRRGDWGITTTCSNVRCLFHKHPMPIDTVDDSIYLRPPSLLIGTVDKFAQLPLNEKMGGLFGWREGVQTGAPPAMIIQDELHLINGPLGSLVGLYEATVDVLSSRGVEALSPLTLESIERNDVPVVWDERPKVIASTATIRNSVSQCNQLYDRRAIKFPASGTDIADSFFVRDRADHHKDKTYVGILCAGIGMKTSMKKVLSTTINQVSIESRTRALEDYDAYWSIVSYFNTTRELGSSVTLLRDDVRNAVMGNRPSMLEERSIAELQGGLSSSTLPLILKNMAEPAGSNSCYDVICCTNMFSVGVDVDRLGIMVMNSQPKATTEYLQATGRVGRDGDGLILTLFNHARPRDQSHFETFYDYHSRIQSHVESMTVTPYSEGCLDRALHAQYVSQIRLILPTTNLADVQRNTDCINYSQAHRDDERSLTFMLYLIQRAGRITMSDAARQTVLDGLRLFQEEWLRRIDEVDEVTKNNGRDKRFQYSQRSSAFQKEVPRLLETNPSSPWLDPSGVADYGYRLRPILTPNSLRNVEEEIELVYLRRRR